MKKIIKDYFTFSKKERIAASILLLLIGGFIALPYLIPNKKIKPSVNKEDYWMHWQNSSQKIRTQIVAVTKKKIFKPRWNLSIMIL